MLITDARERGRRKKDRGRDSETDRENEREIEQSQTKNKKHYSSINMKIHLEQKLTKGWLPLADERIEC